MSLTSILSYSNKEFKHFRNFLLEAFPTPKLDDLQIIKCEPLTTNYMIVGTAFDYLLRFYLEKKYGEKVFARNWVAETGLRYFDDRRNKFIEADGFDLDEMDRDELNDFFKRKTEENENLNKIVNEKFQKCKEIHNCFVSSEFIEMDQVIEAALFLGRLDNVARGGIRMKEYVNLEQENKLNIQDLQQLLDSCNLMLFEPNEKLILNPTFGCGSRLVRGADADLIVDNILIEVKVTKYKKLTRPYFNQLIGYYLLYLIGGIDEHPNIEVKTLGIYFARHDYLWTIPVNEIGAEKDFKKATDLLKRKIN